MLNCLLAAVAAAAQSRAPISTDRPDFTEGARTVVRGSVQLESGVTASAGGEWTLPEGLVRFGASDEVELRFGLPGFVSGQGAQGWADPSLGFKAELDPEGGADFAVIGTIVFAAGGAGVRSARTTPSLAVAWSTGELGGMASAAFPGGATEFRHTLVLSRELSPSVGAFAEHVADFSAAFAPAHTAHFGLVRSLGADAQLDLHFGFGLSGGAQDWFVGAGFAVRR